MTLTVVRKSVWDDSAADMVVITTCGEIRGRADRLVMQAGVSFEASRMFPRLPRVAARRVIDASSGSIGAHNLYGFTAFQNEGRWLGLFQSKVAWDQPANLAMIGFSTVQLRLWMNDNPRIRKVALNMPGQGLIGGLTEAEVLPIISSILDPARVKVYVGPVLGE